MGSGALNVGLMKAVNSARSLFQCFVAQQLILRIPPKRRQKSPPKGR